MTTATILLGLGSWLLLELLQPDTYWPPQLVGLLMSVAGMLLGSTLPTLHGKSIPAHRRFPG